MNFELFLIYGNEYGDRRSGSFQATVSPLNDDNWAEKTHKDELSFPACSELEADNLDCPLSI
jgi:hypothetical protein